MQIAVQWKIMSAFQFQKQQKLNTWALELICGIDPSFSATDH